MITRLEVNESEKCLRLYNQDSEAIIFHDEAPIYLVEYEENKLFTCGYPTHMYLIHQWETVIFILEPISTNTMKTFAFPVPDFNEKSNPFIVVLGEASLNILNVKTCQHKPLINQQMQVGKAGLQGAFIKKEKLGLSLHYANVVQDTDGSGSDIL